MSIFNKLFRKFLSKEQTIQTPGKDQTIEKNLLNNTEEYEIVEKEILPEKMICPDCGGITLVGLEFCDKCGGELMNQDN
ncbi:MAG: hypothetical protein K0S41_277 [Anaerocolumna sp.]|jgi:ribosomal protein S27AE|nr:hypothetical protein [Anaerocolumna sp.]